MTNNNHYNLLEGLNAEQVEATTHEEGPALVVAGAGSGKTRVIVHRIARLARVRGVDPRRVLAVTFTKKGTGEMDDRLNALIGAGRGTVTTFHGLCRSILQKEMSDFASWHPEEVGRADKRYEVFLKQAVGNQGMKWRKAEVSVIKGFIELAKADALGPSDPAAHALAERRYERKRGHESTAPDETIEAYRRAEAMRRDARIMTFADWLVEVWRIFKTNAAVRHHWAARYDYVIQDEAQDQSFVQLDLIEMLAEAHRNLMLVGDVGQTIYAFRGAAPEKFTSFPKRWGARVIQLPRNYRSGQHLVNIANAVAQETFRGADARTSLEMVADRTSNGAIVVRNYPTQEDEGRGVTSLIRALHEGGAAWQECAVLFRTNAMSRSCEEAMIQSDVPYHIVGGMPFYERSESRNLIAYLRVAACRAKVEHALISLRTPFRYLSKRFLEAVETGVAAHVPGSTWRSVVSDAAKEASLADRPREAVEEWADLLDELRAMMKDGDGPSSLLNHVIVRTGYNKWLVKEEGRDSVENDRLNNVAELIRAAEPFPSVEKFIEHIDVSVAATRAAAAEDAKADRVQLMTLHKSKGLEWPHVFMVTVNDRMLPHSRAEDLSEELRIFYVGLTRARDTLDVSWVDCANSNGKKMDLCPSPYLKYLAPHAKRLDLDGLPPEDFDEEGEDEYPAADGEEFFAGFLE